MQFFIKNSKRASVALFLELVETSLRKYFLVMSEMWI